jgi:hypothetical protein
MEPGATSYETLLSSHIYNTGAVRGLTLLGMEATSCAGKPNRIPPILKGYHCVSPYLVVNNAVAALLLRQRFWRPVSS